MDFFIPRNTFEVDLIDPLLAYFKKEFRHKSPRDLESIFASFQHDRDSLIRQLHTASSQNALLQAMDIWLTDVLFLNGHVDIPLHGDSSIQFQWTGITSSERITHSSWLFEIGNLILNFIMIYIDLGSTIERTTPQNWHEVSKYFKKAQTLLTFLKSSLFEPLSRISPCFDKQYISCLLFMTEAQIYNVMYDKAVSDGLNRSLLSKLAYTVSLCYQNAASQAKALVVKRAAFTTLLLRFSVQQYAFLAAAHFQKVQHDMVEVTRQSQGYGAILSRLKLVLDLCQQSQKSANEVAGLVVDLEAVISSSQKLHDEIDSDNRLVYLEVVPPISALPPLEELNAPSNTEALEKAESNLNDLHEIIQLKHKIAAELHLAFADCIPKQVKEMLSVIVAGTQESLEHNAQQIADSKTRYQRMIKSYELDKISMEIHDTFFNSQEYEELWAKIKQIQDTEALIYCDENINNLLSFHGTLLTSFDSIRQKLETEEHDTEKYFAKYGGSFRVRPSREVTTRFYTPYQVYKDAFEKAEKLNNELKSDWDCITSEYRGYFLGDESMLRTYFASPILDESALSEYISQISKYLKLSDHDFEEFDEELDKCRNVLAKFLLEWRAELIDKWKRHQLNTSDQQMMIATFKSYLSSSKLDHILQNTNLHLSNLQKYVVQNYDKQNKMDELSFPNSRSKKLKVLEQHSATVLRSQAAIKEGLVFFQTLTTYLDMINTQVEQWLEQRKVEIYEALKFCAPGRQQNCQTPSYHSSGNQASPQPYSFVPYQQNIHGDQMFSPQMMRHPHSLHSPVQHVHRPFTPYNPQISPDPNRHRPPLYKYN